MLGATQSYMPSATVLILLPLLVGCCEAIGGGAEACGVGAGCEAFLANACLRASLNRASAAGTGW